jgi:ABC-type branched-subunit amino acid transport system substrate-binding protein
MKKRKLACLCRTVLVLSILASFALILPSFASAVSGLSSADLVQLRQKMSIPTGKAAGAGLKIPIGVSLPMSGGAEEFSGPMMNGVKLGLKMVKEMGGPDFQPTFYDIQMGVAQLGVNAITDMGGKGVGMALVGWAFCAYAQIPGAQKYHILMLDPGGGTGSNGKGFDYAWGTRMDNNQAEVAGAIMYAVKTHPNFKTVMSIGQDYGPDANNALTDMFQKQLAAANKLMGTKIRYVGDERAANNTNDYSSLIAKINQKNPDILIMVPFDGNAPILFMKQITSGQPIKAMTIGADWSETSSKQAGATWTNYYYSSQAIFPEYMTNPLASAFYKAYKAEYNSEPNMYSMGFFEDCFTLWDLVRRVIAKGGNPRSGEQLQNALKANPSFQSVYNGDKNTVGKVHWDVKTHDPIDMTIFICMNDVKNYKLIPVASFGDKGVNFKMIGK